jgi:hypothetical protein
VELARLGNVVLDLIPFFDGDPAPAEHRHPLPGQAVDVRSAGIGAAEGADIAAREVIDIEDDDVRALGVGVEGRRQHRGEKKEQGEDETVEEGQRGPYAALR